MDELTAEELIYHMKKRRPNTMNTSKMTDIDLEFCEHRRVYNFNTGEPITEICKECEKINA